MPPSVSSDAASTVDVVSLDIHEDAERRLNSADDQQCDIIAPSPEQSAQARDDGARHDQNQEEATDVVPERDIAPADRSRREIMAKESDDE
jgi:hypothetical protein